MGFFDRFKNKKEDSKVEEQRKQPLTLQYSDGTVADITFGGTCDIEGKVLHSARVIYTSKDGTFTSRNLLLEPIIYQQDGKDIDATEQYYREMANRDGSQEAATRYGVLKGFFKSQEITEQKMGSNYIGRVSKKENGEYYRYFDEGFRPKYVAKTREENQAREVAKQQKDDEFLAGLRSKVENRPINIKTSHAEILTPEKNPYANR